jgi:putative membrane protein
MIKGFLMGSADIVPGVSGGTMALITGIYDRLIFAIKSVNSKAIASALTFRMKELFSYVHWKFILLLVSGIILAIIFFTRVVPLQVYMFTHPEIVYGCFLG